ncbi:MAG TPA: SDR family NAD(P)-dependent oxidoreductase, partial [bacterium]|nr:SDR family NAD(P)-dependent oxidoreductase [bacterium]
MNDAQPLPRILSLDGRVAVVAGGAGGIGRAVVERLLEAGARVASVDRPGTTAVDGAESVPCDVADAAAVDALFDDLERRFDRLDALVHCAGITRDGVLWKLDPSDWDEVLRVNLGSAFLLLRRAAPWMRRTGRGTVVLVSSINGERGKFGQANYAASKAGLHGLART